VNDNQAALHNMQVRLASMEDEIEKWKLLLGVGGWQLDRRFAQQQDKIDALETRVIRRLEMVEADVFSKPAPEPEMVTINKAALFDAWELLNDAKHRAFLAGLSQLESLIVRAVTIIYEHTELPDSAK
jgi:hypothetical protein